MKEIALIIGRFGSGKTEFALNYAVQSASRGESVVLADIDLVNPYFTSGLQCKLMKDRGIRLIASVPSDETVEIPADINALFDEKWDRAILDVGGDPIGARVLGSLYSQLEQFRDCVKAYYIVNTRRPMSLEVEEICEGIFKIENVSRVKIDYLVNNTNLGKETCYDIIAEGDEKLKKVSSRLDVPIKYFMATAYALQRAKTDCHPISGELFQIEEFNRPEWIDSTLKPAMWSTNRMDSH